MNQETRDKISNSLRGNIPWNKGLTKDSDSRLRGSPGAKNGMYGRNGNLNPAWKGGRRKNYAGYVMVHRPGHPSANPQGYVFEHRLIMEEILGRHLTRKEAVHHIDQNRENNSPCNLMLFSDKGRHYYYHKRNLRSKDDSNKS